MRHYFERGLMSRPEKAFAWSYAFILQIGYAPVWFKTFWFGKSKFQDLLDMCQLNCVDVEERKSKKYLVIFKITENLETKIREMLTFTSGYQH